MTRLGQAFRRAVVLAAVAATCGPASAFASSAPDDCKAWPTSSRELLLVLGQRAVEAAALVQAGERSDARLDAWIARDASFDLGAGDVGRQMGKGAAGFRKLLEEIHPDHYRFDGWDFMNSKKAPCSASEVTVEFSSQKEGGRAEVTFRFVDGRIVQAKGWYRTMTAGEFPITTLAR